MQITSNYFLHLVEKKQLFTINALHLMQIAHNYYMHLIQRKY